MDITLTLIAILACIVAIPIASSRGSNPWIWSPISLLIPATLAFSLHHTHQNPSYREFAIRFTLAVVLGAIGFIALQTLQGHELLYAYEDLILSNASILLNLAGVTHYKDGSVFELPYIIMEIPRGTPYLYFSISLGVASAAFSVFLRYKQPLISLLYIVTIFAIGHALSIGVLYSIFTEVKGPNDLNQGTIPGISDRYRTIGVIALYSILALFAWLTKNKMNQNQSAHTTPAIAPR